MQTLTDKNFDAFAKAVRVELSDLPKREIQDSVLVIKERHLTQVLKRKT